MLQMILFLKVSLRVQQKILKNEAKKQQDEHGFPVSHV